MYLLRLCQQCCKWCQSYTITPSS